MVVAFMQSMRIDRLTARAYLDKTRAELAAEAALARAVQDLTPPAPASPTYDTQYYHFGIGLEVDPSDARNNYHYLVSFKNTAPPSFLEQSRIPLLSLDSNAEDTFIEIADGTFRRVSAIPILDSNGNEESRLAYFVVDENSKQSLIPVRQPPGNRELLASQAELPLIRHDGTVYPLTSDLIANWNDAQAALVTPMTVNQVLPGLEATPDEFSPDNKSPVLAPNGLPKIDLDQLQSYLNGLSVQQGAGNVKARVVESLLNLDHLDRQDNWGGGHLGWLVENHPVTGSPPYTTSEARQIIASLIDYLDADLFPTTNDIDDPLYFGVEGEFSGDLADPTTWQVTGHPYINFVGTGLVFNRSSESGEEGGLNSTRVLATIGLANPWNTQTKDYNVFYSVEIEIEVRGRASGGNLGRRASAYFRSELNDPKSLFNFPISNIPPNSAYSFPEAMSGVENYASFFSILNEHGRQPPDMQFSGLAYRIQKLRLKYTQTDGVSGIVQTLDNLESINIPASPADVRMGFSDGSLVYKFPINSGKQDLHLNNDPRLNFLASSWRLSTSTTNGEFAPDPTGTIINVFSGMDSEEGDGVQGMNTSHRWYSTSATENHFFAMSRQPPPRRSKAPPPESVGEIGFLFTGNPWQTLRLYQNGSAQIPDGGDWELLDYVTTGTLTTEPDGELPGIEHAAASINPNTATLNTLISLFSEVDEIDTTAGEPQQLAETVYDYLEPDGAGGSLRPFFFPPSQMFGLNNFYPSGATSDFQREALARKTASVITGASKHFTIIAVGEARRYENTVARAKIRAQIELKFNPATSRLEPVILSQRFE